MFIAVKKNNDMKKIKVLLISGNNFNQQSNNGKTFEAIFSQFERSDISQLFFQQVGNLDFNYCFQYYNISIFNVLKSIFWPYVKTGHELLEKDNKHNMVEVQKEIALRKKIPSSMGIFRDLIWYLGHWFKPEFKLWLKKVDPDFVFYVGGGTISNIDIALKISKFLDKPICVYYTDDYLLSPQRKTLFDKVYYILLEKKIRNLFSKSVLRFTIGDLMTECYKKYFGLDFYTIMNSVKIPEYIPYNNIRDPFIFSYMGGLTLNRWRMLARLAHLLPSNAELRVYSVHQLDEQMQRTFNMCGVKFMGAISGNALLEVKLNSDILVHVESDDEYSRLFTKYSVSTKIPEYLSSGRPVLGFGPQEVASMKILTDNNIGFQISSSETEEYITKKAKVKILKIDEEKNLSRIQIVIHEGKNREVRKMCEAIGKKVLALHRSKIGNIDVKDLRLGKWRFLTQKEIDDLMKNSSK